MDQLALKLTACVLFFDQEPILDPSLDHHALADQEFRPDLMALDDSGFVSLWVECGRTTSHKLDKLTRRYPSAKIVVLKASEAEGRRLRREVEKRLDRHRLLQIWAWPPADFALWRGALSQENICIVGETSGRSMNLTVNSTPLAADLLSV